MNNSPYAENETMFLSYEDDSQDFRRAIKLSDKNSQVNAMYVESFRGATWVKVAVTTTFKLPKYEHLADNIVFAFAMFYEIPVFFEKDWTSFKLYNNQAEPKHCCAYCFSATSAFAKFFVFRSRVSNEKISLHTILSLKELKEYESYFSFYSNSPKDKIRLEPVKKFLRDYIVEKAKEAVKTETEAINA